MCIYICVYIYANIYCICICTNIHTYIYLFIYIHSYFILYIHWSMKMLVWAAILREFSQSGKSLSGTTNGRVLFRLPPIFQQGLHRRKFRSQTSDNMEGWKSRGGNSQRREESREEKEWERVRKSDKEWQRVTKSEKEWKRVRKSEKEWERVRKSEKKEDAGRKVAIHCVFQRFVGSQKRRVRSHLARWEMKNGQG